jgi:hypothetical protein
VLFGSYNHFFVPPPIENVLAGNAGLTRLVSEIGRPLPPLRALKENQFEAGLTHPIAVGPVGVTGSWRAQPLGDLGRRHGGIGQRDTRRPWRRRSRARRWRIARTWVGRPVR